VYADAGFNDIRIAYCTVGDDKWRRIAALSNTCDVSFCVDTADGIRAASVVFSEIGVDIPVLIEIDNGYGRCGVHWSSDETVALAKLVSELPGLSFRGILTHAGDSYRGPQSNEETLEDALRRASNSERDRMLAVAARLTLAGLKPDVVSVGSTPSMRFFQNVDREGLRITEIRPGNYIFNDLTQVGLGVATLGDCAQTVLATVISLHRENDGCERFFLDSGKKVLTSDSAFGHEGYGALLYNARTMVPLPHAMINALSEEHGWVRVSGGATVDVGDRLRLVANHSCVVMNTQKSVYLVDGYDVLEEIRVDAQSAVT
ncbi:MAG: D-TA family PLP-dependent enzyme, partial [Rhodothermales bacterium]|nr:D-TA family PLP-dependent enzyme [Rhodothermales bacterium]